MSSAVRSVVSRNYLIDASIQLRFASYLVAVACAISLGLGWRLWIAYSEASRLVNGREFSGPVNVVRKATLGEISFVDLVADGNTSAWVGPRTRGRRRSRSALRLCRRFASSWVLADP